MGIKINHQARTIRKDFQLTPTKKIMEAKIIMMINAVPKSGCFNISKKGAITIRKGTKSSFNL